MAEQTFKDTSGKAWIVWMQEKNASCAAAAAYMAITMRRLQCMRGGESKYIDKMTKNGSKYTDFLGDIGNKSMNQIGEILASEGLKILSTKSELPDLKKRLSNASTTLPVIVNVAWSSGGAHQVICAGLSGSQMIFLDPTYGLIEQSPDFFPNYTPVKNASTDQAAGQFTGWFTQIY